MSLLPRPFRFLLHQTGSPAHPVLVLGNSLGTDIRLWTDQEQALSKRYRIVRFDYPGHGAQTFGSAGTLSDMAQALVVSLIEAGIDRFAYCGISMGAAVGLELACAFPQRVQALVLANAAPQFGSSDFWQARIAKAQTDGMNALAAPTVARWLTDSHANEDRALVSDLQAMFSATALEGYVSCAEAVMHFDARPLLPRVKTPCLVIAGSQDLATTVAQAHALRDGIAGSGYLELQAAHLSNLGQPDAFTTCVDAFLQQHLRTM